MRGKKARKSLLAGAGDPRYGVPIMLASCQKPGFIFSLVLAFGVGVAALPSSGHAAPEPSVHPAGDKKKEAAGKTAAETTPPVAPPATPATAAAAPEPPGLTKEQIDSAVSLDAMTMPTPGELFAALNKQCKPMWSGQYRGPVSTAFSDRGQLALNLGGLIADGYVAVEAMDSQQVKNLGRDILVLAKNLGISKEILGRGKSIIEFADDSDWASLREELEATQNEVKQALDGLHDEELVTLLSLGGWIRGTEVVSSVVLKNFSGQTASILRQPALVDFLRGKIDKLSDRTKNTPLIKELEAGLDNMKALVSFPLGETASREDVQKLNDQAAALVKTIATR